MNFSRLSVLAALLSSFAFFAACDSSTSSDNGSDEPKKETFHGEPNFFCNVTDGDSWVKMELNIPKYKGMVRKIDMLADGSYYEYYEETYFDLNPWEMKEMCLEYEYEAKEKGAEDIQCGNGRFSMGQNRPKRDENILFKAKESFKSSCEDYAIEWERGEFSDDDDESTLGNALTESLQKCDVSVSGNTVIINIVFKDWSMVGYATFEPEKVRNEYVFIGNYGDMAQRVCRYSKEIDSNVVCEEDKVAGDDFVDDDDRLTVEESKTYATMGCKMLMDGTLSFDEFVLGE